MKNSPRGFLKIAFGAWLGLAPVTALAQDVQPGDPEAGERVFRRCAACHTFDPDQRRTGPHLADLFGRVAGSVEGFRYSDAMTESGITWNEETLRPYLENPRAVVPGTRMVLRLRRPQEIEDVIAYLRQQSGE
ncbi:MAG: cytochrome c family protein [Pseudomonadota bacterium]